MASDAPSEVRAAAQARRLSEALDAIEARLDALGEAADIDVVVRDLASPVAAFDACAKEALS